MSAEILVRLGLEARRAFRVWNQTRKGETPIIDEDEPVLRTSTKQAIGGFVGGVVVPALALIPFHDQINSAIMLACEADNGPLAYLTGAGFTLAISTWVARKSKTPANPGKL